MTPTPAGQVKAGDVQGDQFSALAEAQYALVKLQLGDKTRDWLADAKTWVNSLNPNHFSF